MAVSFVAATHVANSSGTATEPAGAAQNDMLIAMVWSDFGISGTGLPAGWTEVGAFRNNGASNFTQVYNIVRGGSAPALTWSDSANYRIDVVAYRGARATFDITGQSAAVSAVAPSVTTTTVNGMLVCLYQDTTDTSITVPAGMTSRAVAGSQCSIGELALTSAGATGTKTFTTITTAIAAWSIALALPTPSPALFQPTTPRVWSTFQ